MWYWAGGRATCEVCGGQYQVYPDGALASHTYRPRRKWWEWLTLRTPRTRVCPGAGRLPKEVWAEKAGGL